MKPHSPHPRTEFGVSDHAVLRFLERTGRIDLRELHDEILPERAIEQARVLGDGRYPIGNGLLAVIKGGTVVTVLVHGGEKTADSDAQHL